VVLHRVGDADKNDLAIRSLLESGSDLFEAGKRAVLDARRTLVVFVELDLAEPLDAGGKDQVCRRTTGLIDLGGSRLTAEREGQQ
jgi:hypothetical protein